MIVDSLQNTEVTEKIHPLLKKAFDFIRDSDFSKIKDGEIKTDDPRLHFVIVTVQGKKKSEVKVETHNKHIEIHAPLLGVEKIGWKSGVELMLIATPYNEEKDITFFIDQPTSFIKIYPGQFVLCHTEDGHATGIGEGLIRKIIAKITLDE